MIEAKYLFIIIGMGIVTYGTRFLPLFLFKDRSLNRNIMKWMKYVPITILSAIIAPDVFMPEPSATLDISFRNPYLVAATITMVAALKIKNLVAVIGIGMVSILILKNFVIF